MKVRTQRIVDVLGAALTAAALLSCTGGADEPESTGRVSLPVSDSRSVEDADSQIGVYDLHLAERSAEEMSRAAERLAAVFLGKGKAVAVRWLEQDQGLSFGIVDGDPELRVQYWAAVDGMEAVDPEPERDRSSKEDVGPDTARALFEAAAEAMAASGAFARGAFDVSTAALSRTWQGEGRSDEPPVTRVAEYRFFVPLRLGGVVVTDGGHQDLGLEVIVHRTGRLSALRVTGLGLLQQTRLAPLASVRRAMTREDMDRLVAKLHPDADVVSVGTRYALPHTADSKVSEPSQLYRVSRRVILEDMQVNELAVWLYYSVQDPARSPRIWPPR